MAEYRHSEYLRNKYWELYKEYLPSIRKGYEDSWLGQNDMTWEKAVLREEQAKQRIDQLMIDAEGTILKAVRKAHGSD